MTWNAYVGNTTRSPVTKDIRHILPLPSRERSSSELAGIPGGAKRIVQTKDRVKWWNIVPGDQVRVMADKMGLVREVLGVNKISNRVYVQNERKVCWRLIVCDIHSFEG